MQELDAISNELSLFLESKSPTSTILAGAPGTGKTTLALQILDLYKDKYMGIYLSTRVGDRSLYQHFPWLKKIEEKTKIIDASRIFIESLKYEEQKTEETHLETARELIRNIYGEPPHKLSRLLYKKNFGNINIPELARIYNEVEQNLPKRSILVIDSIEGLAAKYRINEEDLVYTLVKDLIEGGNTDIIFVLEKERSEKLEYITDSLILLDQSIYEDRRVRSLNIVKMRGISFNFNRFLVTLNGGRFTVFSPTKEIAMPISKNIMVSGKNREFLSTGSKDLDEILGGGFKYGSFNLISVNEDVSKRQFESFYTRIIINTLAHGSGVISLLSLGETVEHVREMLSQEIPKEALDTLTKFIDYSESIQNKKYVIPLKGPRESSMSILNREIAGLKKDNGAIVYSLSLSSIERNRGPVAMAETIEFINNIIDNKDIGIALAKPGVMMEKYITSITTTHIRLLNIYNAFCLYGNSPRTILYALVPSGTYLFDLVPIV